MAWIVDNWMIIVAACAVAGLIGWRSACFLKQDRSVQLNNVKEWLLWAVTEAERAFGAGTGKLKLRYVYDNFLATFPWLVKAVSFPAFSALVDEALTSMREMLQSNERVKNYVSGAIIIDDDQVTTTYTSGHIYGLDEDKFKNK